MRGKERFLHGNLPLPVIARPELVEYTVGRTLRAIQGKGRLVMTVLDTPLDSCLRGNDGDVLVVSDA